MTRLRHERKARRLSQARLGREVNIPQSDVSQIERGILTPSKEQLERLAAYLGVEGTDLLKDVVVVVEARA